MKYGCIPEFDIRDYQVRANVADGQLPKSFCLPKPQKIKNQGVVCSCVAHAMSSILEYYDGGRHELSTNFIYGFHDSDSFGMSLNDACKIVNKYGDMLKSDCDGNYEVPLAHKEFKKSIDDDDKLNTAYNFRVDSYFSCSNNNDIKFAIMNYGAVLASVKWYDDYKFDKKTSSIIFNDKSPYSYHAVVIYGWNEHGFICQNSWGEKFGNKGTFVLPYSQEVVECKAFVDYVQAATDDNLVIKDHNVVLDIICKVLNTIINIATYMINGYFKSNFKKELDGEHVSEN